MDSIFTEKEALMMKKRFIDKQTLEEVGKFFGVTRERIRQIEAKCLEKIRSMDIVIDKDDLIDKDIVIKFLKRSNPN